MTPHPSSQPFRFLDLPGELRNNIYDMLLCSWDDELEQDSGLLSKLSRRSPSYPATALLRTNKQIQAEASDYMIKRNQFVRITCRGLDIRKLFLGDQIPIITTNNRKVDQFQGYVMHMTLSKPAFTPSVFRFPDFEIMLLRADLPKLCSQLDVETVMEDINSTTNTDHASLRAEIKLNYSYARFFTPKIQEVLLSPVSTLLRGLPSLPIYGPVDATLAHDIAAQVAQPRWTDPQATLEEIGTGIDVGKRQMQQSNMYSAATSWSYALRTLNRIRHSTSWAHLAHTDLSDGDNAGGETFVNKIADLYFTLNLLHARFLQLDMMTTTQLEQQPVSQPDPAAKAVLHHLHNCSTASARFAQHANATWQPSPAQSAKMLFRHARCLRLMRHQDSSARALALIQRAVVLAPNERAMIEERDAVLAWVEQVEVLQERERERQRPTRSEEEQGRGGVLSQLWTAVVELAG